jgi:hypothetical protein
MLTVASLYILEVVCYIKKYKVSLEHKVQIHNYNTQRKQDLHVHFCNKAFSGNLELDSKIGCQTT